MSVYYPLFEHLSREHGLTLTDSELVDVLQSANKCCWFQITKPEDLSCGSWYFYINKNDSKKNTFLGEFGDNEISCEQELLCFNDEFPYENYWFCEFVAPKFDMELYS